MPSENVDMSCNGYVAAKIEANTAWQHGRELALTWPRAKAPAHNRRGASEQSSSAALLPKEQARLRHRPLARKGAPPGCNAPPHTQASAQPLVATKSRPRRPSLVLAKWRLCYCARPGSLHGCPGRHGTVQAPSSNVKSAQRGQIHRHARREAEQCSAQTRTRKRPSALLTDNVRQGNVFGRFLRLGYLEGLSSEPFQLAQGMSWAGGRTAGGRTAAMSATGAAPSRWRPACSSGLPARLPVPTSLECEIAVSAVPRSVIRAVVH
eukprot:676439-Pleurochrysis_carterae.AAC.3